jgi:hypothetical protein
VGVLGFSTTFKIAENFDIIFADLQKKEYICFDKHFGALNTLKNYQK